MILQTKLAILAVKTSPILGGLAFVAAIESQSDGPWVVVWRAALSVAIGVFGTLVAAIYRQHNKRVNDMQKEIKEMSKRNERMLGSILLITLANKDGKQIDFTELIKAVTGSDRD